MVGCSCYSPYALSLRVGESKTIQLFNADGTIYVIPDGSTVAAKAVDRLKVLQITLNAVVQNASQGLIGLQLPDTPDTRSKAGQTLVYDVTIVSGAAKKTLPASTLKILYSPSL